MGSCNQDGAKSDESSEVIDTGSLLGYLCCHSRIDSSCWRLHSLVRSGNCAREASIALSCNLVVTNNDAFNLGVPKKRL